MHLLILPAALALDLSIGDPPGMPHPVRLMGWAIQRLEARCWHWPLAPLVAGAVHALTLVIASGAVAWALLQGLRCISPLLAAVVEAALLFSCLSIRSLLDAALAVRQPLQQGDLPEARRRLAGIVGRDTHQLDRDAISRATVETVAENFVDGVLSPLCYAMLGGAPLAIAYKMINTLDSMVGYRNERYLHFGRVAARLDDIANFVPARLSVPLIALAAWLLGGPWRRAMRVARADRLAHASPNSGHAEAAFAGALGIWLGGANRYGGRLVEKPVIGRGLAAARPTHIDRACHLLLIAALLAAALVWLGMLARHCCG
jgi:adenosylcobinamide-phosphate synthase